MKANELRICSWVKHPAAVWSHRTEVQGYGYVEFQWEEHDWAGIAECTINLEEVKPIPLTEEWLFKFGFKFDGHCSWWKNELIELTIDIGEDEYSVFNDNGDYITLKGIKYVHQLQNLYFAIKGEELTIKTIDQ
jgi:hypothetical protein